MPTIAHAVGTEARVLVAVPAYNEQATIAAVVEQIRTAVPEFDLLVVNDASSDDTAALLARLQVTTATHLANLGYGRAVQTAIKYAHRSRYDVLITLDADGQHDPADIRRVFDAFAAGRFDLMIGSRFVQSHDYGSEPRVRRFGMRLFSALLALLAGQRIYDTSSGLNVIHARVFEPLSRRPFVDFHAESLVYLIKAGYLVGECPVAVAPRRHGASMHTPINWVKYPLKVTFLIVLNVIEAHLFKRGEA